MSSDGNFLSQDEIDALLRMADEEPSNFSTMMTSDAGGDDLTAIEKDALGEIGNITFGSAATSLSTLLGKKVDITTPTVEAISKEEAASTNQVPAVSVKVDYCDGFEGSNVLIIKKTDAQIIADLMLGGDGSNTFGEVDEIQLSAVQEAMNQMMGASATSMSTLFNRFVNISPPSTKLVQEENDHVKNDFKDEEKLVRISFNLLVGDLINSKIYQIISLGFAKEMVQMLMGGAEEISKQAEETANANKSKAPVNAGSSMGGMGGMGSMGGGGGFGSMDSFGGSGGMGGGGGFGSMEPFSGNAGMGQGMSGMPMNGMGGFGGMDPYGGMGNQMMGGQMGGMGGMGNPMMGGQMGGMGNPMMGGQMGGMGNPMMGGQMGGFGNPMMGGQMGGMPMGGGNINRNVNVQPVQFSNFNAGPPIHGDDNNLNLLLDIPLKVTVELGRTKKLVKEILEFSQGSVIELDKLAGEPVDILVNNKLIAKGEVVVIDENFGVRVTDIVSQWDRIQKLR